MAEDSDVHHNMVPSKCGLIIEGYKAAFHMTIPDDRGRMEHLNGAGWLEDSQISKIDEGAHDTYTTTPSSTVSVLEGMIGLPSESNACSMLTAHKMVAMAMKRDWLAKYCPIQILPNV